MSFSNRIAALAVLAAVLVTPMALAGPGDVVSAGVSELEKRIAKVDQRTKKAGKRLTKLTKQFRTLSKQKGPQGPAGPRGLRGEAGPVGPVGPQGPAGATGFQEFRVAVAFGTSQTLVQNGTLTLTAQCLENVTDNQGNPNQDVARVLISTTLNGAVFDSSDDSQRGTLAGDFLNVDTPDADRVFAEDAVPHGLAEFDRGAEEGAALDSNGKGFILPENGIAFAHALYGDDCNFAGAVQMTG